MEDSPHRRNPLRLIVTKDTQLRILWLVGGGVFFSLAVAGLCVVFVPDWVWRIVLALVAGSLASLWVSRRIAGPFYRIEKDLETLLQGAGRGQKVRLREGDPLEHLADLVNNVIEKTER